MQRGETWHLQSVVELGMCSRRGTNRTIISRGDNKWREWYLV